VQDQGYRLSLGYGIEGISVAKEGNQPSHIPMVDS
jgi:hypothetical protein